MPVVDNHIFQLDPSVERTAVFYENRFGILLAGELYVSRDADLEAGQLPAIVVGPPFGGVKEQGPGVYANQLAQRGFVALAFDPSYFGESGGEPRYLASSEIQAEDFSAGVDFLGSLPYVDRNRIGAIGICGSGGWALSAAAMDPRIKAVVASAMYDIPRAGRLGFPGMPEVTAEQRKATLREVAAQRWADVDAGKPALSFNANIDYRENLNPITAEFASFYSTPRGYHPGAIAAHTITSSAALMNFQINDRVAETEAPILLVTGDAAHSKPFADEIMEKCAAGGKTDVEMVVVPDCNHVDLYDDVDKIPFDRLEAFFAAM